MQSIRTIAHLEIAHMMMMINSFKIVVITHVTLQLNMAASS